MDYTGGWWLVVCIFLWVAGAGSNGWLGYRLDGAGVFVLMDISDLMGHKWMIHSLYNEAPEYLSSANLRDIGLIDVQMVYDDCRGLL